ncbi:hypothetical protein IWT5_00656 [Secundilactobacillus silagincola]|uniref:CRISPR-associated protein Cse2 n=1 Tax=Secundilactobacillus silagincola TaxID=1714681 RepID=A0A1Z5H5E2_9LACO|nr:type I-E CRISPR-associated protein Cse2/CasB [Secundilactobacillus silagincola]GAT18382.1 hypothetical protein IWT5_00656 [Secundilactobacillus silagincola]
MNKAIEAKVATIKIINALYNENNVDKATLSSLRGAPTIVSQRAETVWPIMLPYMAEDLLSPNGRPSWGENAVYTATRLFALYQQGNDQLVYAPYDKEKSESGKNFFSALAVLRRNPDSRDALDRRAQALFGSSNFGSVVHSLTQLASILKSNKLGIKIDFPVLAQNLFDFQTSFENASTVKLLWGQEYYADIHETKPEGTK